MNNGALGHFTALKSIVICCANVLIVYEIIHAAMTLGNTHMLGWLELPTKKLVIFL